MTTMHSEMQRQLLNVMYAYRQNMQFISLAPRSDSELLQLYLAW